MSGEKAMTQETIDAAVEAIDAFDQANTARAIERMGSRGQILAAAINGMRLAIVREGGRPTFVTDPNGPTGGW